MASMDRFAADSMVIDEAPALHIHSLGGIGQGQLVELQTAVLKQVPGPATILLNPARSISSARSDLTTGVGDPADWRWLAPRAIQDAVITIAAVDYVAEHLHSPDILLAGFLFWLMLRGRGPQRPT
jgi:hypothetical protein